MAQVQREVDINGSIFRVDARYDNLVPIGQGATGLVCAPSYRVAAGPRTLPALEFPEFYDNQIVIYDDRATGRNVAIKKISNSFANLEETKRTLREIKLLSHFHHENILELIDVQRPADREHFTELYVVTGLMETDLHHVICSAQPLSEKHVQYFIYQTLRGVKYMHSSNVLHRDLKPSNLLVNSDATLRICDFGLARVALPLDDETPLHELPLITEYVSTRWYRAPEVILSWKQYTKAIDLWAVGCIFAELLRRRPLFQGADYMHQLNKIVDVLGSPLFDDLAAIHNDAARAYIERLDRVRLRLGVLETTGLDLMSALLQFNPHRRITAELALAHPYLAAFHKKADEVPPAGPAMFNFDFEDYKLSLDQYRELIYCEGQLLHW